MIEVELPEKLQGAKNYCVCLELEEEEPIFEAIIDCNRNVNSRRNRKRRICKG